MPVDDIARLDHAAKAPRLVTLWKQLQRLSSIVSFMNTGAHPDDETSYMLAALGWRDGLDLSYACSTRGESGQNNIGRESGAALGTIRTAEMEAACDILGLRLYWFSAHEDNPIIDFGFSKSGEETIERWGREKTLRRFVEIIRSERPDILCPTFLDVPGQHGHHRAMTQALIECFELATDPSFKTGDLKPWTASKLYLPAWSGAGQAYDDDLPPPPTTLTISCKGEDPVTGWTYETIGQMSRRYHVTQGMGAWITPGIERDAPLHLLSSRTNEPDHAIKDGLPATLADLDDTILNQVQSALDTCRAAFPDTTAILKAGSEALQLLRMAIETRKIRGTDNPHLHRLLRKEVQIQAVLTTAAGVEASAIAEQTNLMPGSYCGLSVEFRKGSGQDAFYKLDLPHGWSMEDGQLRIGEEASESDPFPLTYFPDTPATPCIETCFELDGQTVTHRHPMIEAPIILPAHMARVTPERQVLNLQTPQRALSIELKDCHPTDALIGLELPAGWTTELHSDHGKFHVPDDAVPGHHTLALTLSGHPARTSTFLTAPHIQPRALATPAVLHVALLDVVVPEVRIGYIGSGNDRVDHWLKSIGCDIHPISDAELASDEALAGYDTILVGIFAMQGRQALSKARPRLHGWVRNGGNLVTLYHRPWDNWDPERTPPARLEIGQPSLRWRITDENAKVSLLNDHPVLQGPNPIGQQDWQGWVKERGLYFAKSWDPTYTPLLSMADPGEEPLQGALLVGDIGKGRHIHTSLILHHQMEHLVSGAYRLMANLLHPR